MSNCQIITLPLELTSNTTHTLRQQAKPVDITHAQARCEALQVIQELITVLRHTGNGVGLAAPQIGFSQRILVVDDEEHPAFALLNPEISPATDAVEIEDESCLSLPSYTAPVARTSVITVRAVSPRDWNIHQFTATGYLSRIIQHEVDHLNGVLFIDRLADMQDLRQHTEPEPFLYDADSVYEPLNELDTELLVSS